MTSPFTAKDYLAALGVIIIWGTNFVAMKFGLQDFTPFQLGAGRYLAAALPLLFVLRRPALPLRWIVMYGLCQGLGQFGLVFIALKVGMTASLASVLMQTQVFFTALFGLAFLHEPLAGQQKFSLGLGALALTCFGIGVQAGTSTGVTWAGLILNLGGASMWAASNIVARKAQQASQGGPGYDPVAFVVWSSAVPIVPFLLLSWTFDPALSWAQLSQVGGVSWVSVLYLGWMATVVGYALWTGLLKRHPANQVAPLSLGVPVVGLTAGALVLQEVISGWQWAGIALTLLALLVNFRPTWLASLLPQRRAGQRP
jgi:O-acetylserine/cysteine efflux transporter